MVYSLFLSTEKNGFNFEPEVDQIIRLFCNRGSWILIFSFAKTVFLAGVQLLQLTIKDEV